MRALTAIPGLGPKKAMVLYQERGIASIEELVAALDDGRLAGLKGFGPKTEENLRHGIELTRGGAGRALIDVAAGLAEEIVAAISGVPGCQRCTYAGSLRRMRETIGDVDILAAAPDPGPLMAAFAGAAAGHRGHRRAATRRPRYAPTGGCRSTCGWCRWSRGARRCSTSPAPSSTTCGSGRWPYGRA